VSLAVLWLSPSRIRRFAAGRAYRDAYELAGDTHRRPTPRRRRRDAGGGLRLRRHPGAVRRRPRGRGPRPRGGSRARETGRAAPDDRRPALRAQPRRAGRGERRRGTGRAGGQPRFGVGVGLRPSPGRRRRGGALPDPGRPRGDRHAHPGRARRAQAHLRGPARPARGGPVAPRARAGGRPGRPGATGGRARDRGQERRGDRGARGQQGRGRGDAGRAGGGAGRGVRRRRRDRRTRLRPAAPAGCRRQGGRGRDARRAPRGRHPGRGGRPGGTGAPARVRRPPDGGPSARGFARGGGAAPTLNDNGSHYLQRASTVTLSRPLRASALAAAGLLSSSTLAACSGSDTGGDGGDGPDIVASTTVYAGIAEHVAGEHASVESVISDPTADPHSYEASPADAAAVTSADLVVYNGAGYDAFVDMALENAGDLPVVSAVDEFERATSTSVAAHSHDHGDDGHDHSHDHDAEPGTTTNEHVWFSLPTVVAVAERVAEELAEL